MKPTFVLVIGVVVLLGATGAVAADVGADASDAEVGAADAGAGAAAGIDVPSDAVGVDAEVIPDSRRAGEPPWPSNETTTGNDSDVSPGQQLAGAVGAQGASVEGELWNRTLSERLDNATTISERAEVVADETELLEISIEELATVRENVTDSWEDDEIPDGEYRAALSELVVRAHSVERRANRTARVAEDLPEWAREDHDVNVTHVESLSEQAHQLYEFEGEIGQEVANETLANQSAEKRPPGNRRGMV